MKKSIKIIISGFSFCLWLLYDSVWLWWKTQKVEEAREKLSDYVFSQHWVSEERDYRGWEFTEFWLELDVKYQHIDQLQIYPLLLSIISYCVSLVIYCAIYFLFSCFFIALWIFNYSELSWMSLKGLKKTFKTKGLMSCFALKIYLGKLVTTSALLLVCIKHHN